MRVGVVADDLTGACDTVVQFAEAGWEAVLVLEPGASPDVASRAEAVAVCLDSRRDPGAQDLTRAAVAGLSDRVYLKVDSTMRGSVAAQVAGASEAHRRRHPDGCVVLCPAYPAMGRTVEAGHVLVGGASVVDSPAGRDPVTPVPTSDLTRLVPGAVSVPAGTVDELVERLVGLGPRHPVVAVDATSQADLEVLAEAVAVLGPAVLPAGSAGLAGPLARRWRPTGPSRPTRPQRPGRVLFSVSSLHDVARAQVAHLRESVGAEAVDLLTTPEAGSTATTDDAVAVRHAEDLAVRTTTALADGTHGALVLVGGDGARAVTRALDAMGIRVWGSVAEGMPLGTLLGGPHDGLPVITKAGGFGPPTALGDLARALIQPAAPAPSDHQEIP